MKANTYKPHPWHGIPTWQDQSKNTLNVFIEIVPGDTVKYELDKATGYLKVDRPQKFSNIVPSLYGFIPKTYSAEALAEYTKGVLNRPELVGDEDPVDICVLTEKDIRHGDLLLEAKPIGGLRMIDDNEVDDKIVAVLKDDAVYGHIEDIKDCPELVINRLKHYFLTYKQIPKEGEPAKCEITDIYGREEALKIIELSQKDYGTHYQD